MDHVIAVIDVPSEGWSNVTAMLNRQGYSIQTVGSLQKLEALMEETEGRLALIDLDSFPADNRFFKSLKTTKPDSSIFVASSRPYHPDLKEAMSTHICACFRKPLDPDELLFWLKAVSRQRRVRDPTGHDSR